MAFAVVVGAGRPPVAGDGGPAGGPGLDMVDLALLGGDVAHLVKHCWSLTSTARRVAPVNRRRAAPTSTTRDGLSNTTRSIQASSNQ